MSAVTTDPQNHWVYRALDDQGRALYIGCTKSPGGRWKQHRSDRPPWLGFLHRWRLTGPLTKATARQLERAEQIRLQPYWGHIPGRRGYITDAYTYPGYFNAAGSFNCLAGQVAPPRQSVGRRPR